MNDVKEAERHECHVELIDVEIEPGAIDEAEDRFLTVSGMGCPTCAVRVHNALVRIPGVLTADVEVEHGLAQVWLSAPVDEETLVEAIDEAGQLAGHSYLAAPISPDAARAMRASKSMSADLRDEQSG